MTCPHDHVTVYTRRVSIATMEEPEEWDEHITCDDCGIELDDEPEEAQITIENWEEEAQFDTLEESWE